MSAGIQAGSSKGSQQMEVNARGIPRAPFVSNVEGYVGGTGADVQSTIQKFQETSSKYRYMDINLQQRRKALTSKIPDIENTLRIVKFLQNRRKKALGEPFEEEEEKGGSLGGGEDDDDLDDLLDDDDDEDNVAVKGEEAPLKTLFELNDTLYAEAEVEETGEVGIWLGANTMLTYPLQEAIDLLEGKLGSARKSLEEVLEDLEWIREQVTVMEVNFARVHNWDVKRRREQKAQSGLVESSKKDREDSDED
ncbi:Prefoldin subunit-domain-containing protein [Kockovaella imperatae]|uniref:Prefoldin subunit-domain-containing protein n=1 Tax=Kockovaella imperatae TaxID=4999 RepID=A0A1Y1U8V0_9TREE|nr:Prefoldin subunit-domain-containing protein [Kockovaella imperatae]ORX34442.1 Prefoldin subunit-domain-containing protein [Kockovaella imperatae]